MHFAGEDDVKAFILYKLRRKNRWGAKHTEFIHCAMCILPRQNASDIAPWAMLKSLPQEWTGDAERLARELIAGGLLLQWRKTGQLHVSLNPRKAAEIRAFVEAHLGKVFW